MQNDEQNGEREDSSLDELDQQPETQPDREAQPVDAEQPPRLPFAVVGVGASAGGLEAFGEFLQAMRPDSGMAFVFILHLAPDRHSLVAEVLSRQTKMHVVEVDEGMEVVPNHVYVIRPAHVLTIKDAHLHLGPRLDGPRAANRPVDDFFKSLAQEQRERAIAIIMSGMGSNGAAGSQAVKAVGGLCIAQDPESAQFPSMPRHLIDAGYADFISLPRDIPDVLLQYIRQPYATGGREADAQTVLQRERHHVREILAVLRTRMKQDFSGYKKPTVLRRIQRRMGLARIDNIADYARVLRQSPTEASALSDDLLIHVTGFFRDPEAWEALRSRVVVPLVAGRENDSSIRCWVTACSSGEEAYSLAMLLVEESEQTGKHLDIKVFATDMAERTLGNARNGIYPGGIESDISPERLRRFFEKDDATYRVRQEVRECVVFAPQNLLQDPPFSRLDIASCRNLLIYLEPNVQQRVLSLLHFGLREGGTLFLGTSESLGGSEELFEPLDKKARIYRRVGPTRHGMTDFPLPRSLRLMEGNGGNETATGLERRAGLRPTFAQITQRALLEHHIPAAVLIDHDQRILYFQGNTRPFFDQPSGEPTRDLLTLARAEVRGAIRVALHRASAEKAPVRSNDAWIELQPGKRVRVLVTASPVADKTTPAYFVVSFETREFTGAAAAETSSDSDRTDADVIRQMRDELQSTVEEFQATNEELKASHEEVVSVNEELQSSNEELETSKEEMQSLNEELTTVNAQLRAKVEEHQAISDDLASLLASTDIAVLFLDTRLRIRRFTPQVRELFELISSDIGRPLSDLARKFTDEDLEQDGQAVLERLAPIEREIHAQGGKWFLKRVTPYRTADNRIDGVVLSFIDITARRYTEDALRDSEERLKGQKEAFQAAISGAPLEQCLDKLIRAVSENSVKGVRAAFYIVSKDRTRLHPISTHGGMPDSYLRSIDGFEVGDDSLACGLAVSANSPVITKDVYEDPKWTPWLPLAKEYDIRSCWSFPIQSHTGEPFGAFTMYHRRPRDATPRDLALASAITQAAAILISRQSEVEGRARSDAALDRTEGRVAFLLQLNDALRAVSDPLAVQATAAERLGKYLTASRVLYFEVQSDLDTLQGGPGYIDSVEELPAPAKLTDFGQPLAKLYRSGESVVVSDSHDDARFVPTSALDAAQIRALVGVPLLINRQLVALMVVHQASPRAWTPSDVALLEEVAQRTWIAVERAKSDAALREGEERFRLLVEGARDFAMLMLDVTGQIAAWNIAAERLLGFTEKEALGQPGAMIFTPEDIAADVPARELAEAASHGRATDERWHVRKDGSRFWGSGVMRVLRNADGSIRGFVKILRDESARKQLEEAESAALEAAELANQTKDEFLATLSHELRTPLSAILLWAKMLNSQSEHTSLDEGLAAIRNSAEAQKQLIEDLLDTSRITSGHLRLEMRPVELNAVIEGAMESVLPAAQAKGVNVVVDVDSKIGTVRVDPDRLRQVIWNLLANAIKFTPADGTVRLEAQRIGRQVKLRVIDTGSGIDPEFLPHVFELFRQADPASTRRQGGLGLGLAICKKLVEQHGGTIIAQSEGTDRGATFTVLLPAPIQHNRKTAVSSPIHEESIDLEGTDILLVEDQPDMRNALSIMLQRLGVKVTGAESAAAAFTMFLGSRPDLIISDIGMPDEDGYSLIRRIRSHEQQANKNNVPALALTAFASDEDQRKAINAGFNDYLRKPVEPQQLAALLHTLLHPQ